MDFQFFIFAAYNQYKLSDMKLASFFLIFVALVLKVSRQDCVKVLQSQGNISSVQTGSFSLSASQKTGRSVNFNVSLVKNFDKNFQVALSIIYIDNYRDNNGLDFTVTSIQRAGGFLAVLFISEDAQWTSCHVHYLTTDTNNIRAGYFPVDPQYFFNINKTVPNTVPAKYYFGSSKAWVGNKNSQVLSMIFLNGVRTEDNSLDISIIRQGTYYNTTENSLNMFFNISGVESPIESIVISYILYSPTTGYMIKIQVDPFDVVLNSLKNENSSKALVFSGMTGVQADELSKLNKNTRRMLATNLDGTFNFNQINVETFTKSFVVSSIKISSLEVSGLNFLRLTPQALLPLAMNNMCITYDSCIKNGGQFVSMTDGTVVCVACNPNKYFNPATETCECNQGFIDNGGSCVSQDSFCGMNNILVDQTCYRLLPVEPNCQLNQQYNPNNKKCECKSGLSFQNINSTSVCAPSCSRQAQLNLTTLTCECNPGFSFEKVGSNSICVPSCGGVAYFNPNTLQCQCPASFQYVNGDCVRCTFLQSYNQVTRTCNCSTGVIRTVSGKCIVCPLNSKYDTEQDRCICFEGYAGTFCRQIATPPTPLLSIFGSQISPPSSFVFDFNG